MSEAWSARDSAAASVPRAQWLRCTHSRTRATVSLLFVMFLAALPTPSAGQTAGIRPSEEQQQGSLLFEPSRLLSSHSRLMSVAVDDALTPQRARDRWLAADKLRHFFASYGVTALGFGTARLVGLDGDDALPLSVAGAAVAGLGKEVVDVRRGGAFSVRDLLWDAAGIAVAVAVLRNTR